LSAHEEATHRAAAQAVMAMLEGTPFDHVSVDGIELEWPTGDLRPREDMLAEAAIGLAGVAAIDCYRFGIPPPDADTFVVAAHLTGAQLGDWRLVREMICDVDPDDASDALFLVWKYAESTILTPDTWTAIEAIAAALERGPLSAREVNRLARDAAASVLRDVRP